MLTTDDIQAIMQIMSDEHVTSFFQQDEMVRMIMHGEPPTHADMEAVVQNTALNRIMANASLMKRIMAMQDKLARQFEARDDERRVRLSSLLTELGFTADQVQTAMASTDAEPGCHPLRVLQALRDTTVTPAARVVEDDDGAVSDTNAEGAAEDARSSAPVERAT